MKKLFLALAVSILGFASVNTPMVLGCAFDPGDSWYAVDVKVIDNPLSDVLGVSFSGNGELMTLANLGLTSNLYIGSKDVNGTYPGNERVRQDYRPKEEIFGKEFEPNVLVSVGDGMPKGTYVFRGGWGESIGARDQTNSDLGTVSLRSALDSTDNYKSKQKVGDNRPDDAPIPEPDYQTMYAFYEGSRYEIPIVLSYSLKDNYISDRTKNSCAGEEEALRRVGKRTRAEIRKRYIILAISGVILLAASVTIYKVARNNNSKKKPAKKTAKRVAKSKATRLRKK